jgi:hypothetical protein
MRLGLVILLLAGMAVALVHVRRAEVSTRHEIQRLRMRQVTLRRKLWDQQIRVGELTSPREVRKRVEQMKLKLVRPDARGEPMADGVGHGGR